MTFEEIYNEINGDYGSRSCFISELAEKLGISYEKANILTLRAGYSRTKKVKVVSLAEFTADEDVKSIVGGISQRIETTK